MTDSRQVLRHRARKILKNRAAPSTPESPIHAPLMALRNALGDFLVGEAQRYEVPCALVRPDGSNQDMDERASQCSAIDDATTALTNAIVKELVDSAPPGVRLAILASQRGLKKKLEADQPSPSANGETTSSNAASQGTEPSATESEAAT